MSQRKAKQRLTTNTEIAHMPKLRCSTYDWEAEKAIYGELFPTLEKAHAAHLAESYDTATFLAEMGVTHDVNAFLEGYQNH